MMEAETTMKLAPVESTSTITAVKEESLLVKEVSEPISLIEPVKEESILVKEVSEPISLLEPVKEESLLVESVESTKLYPVKGTYAD
jgi:hypothetical protein